MCLAREIHAETNRRTLHCENGQQQEAKRHGRISFQTDSVRTRNSLSQAADRLSFLLVGWLAMVVTVKVEFTPDVVSLCILLCAAGIGDFSHCHAAANFLSASKWPVLPFELLLQARAN
eukprot:s1442_g6.t1